MYVRLKRSVQHLVYSRNRTECMNATRRFNHSRSRYVREKVAYIELLFLCRLDRAILWKGLDNLHSFLEFPFGHGGSKTLSMLIMIIDGGQMQSSTRSFPVRNQRTDQANHRTMILNNPTPSIVRSNAFCFSGGKERAPVCVSGYETNNTCALIRPAHHLKQPVK